jgi:hypothetical protein
MKKYVLFLLVLCCFHLVNAQVIRVDSTSNWKKSFKAGLNLNQASFSDNWKGGGVNSIGFASVINYKADYQKGKNSWNNQFDLLYGMVRNQGQGYRKTLDRMYFDTKYGRSLNKIWDMAASLNFLSQFAPGYNYVKDLNGVEQPNLISDFFAPAFITTALGFEYHPVDYFKVRISPIAPRVTIVRDNNGRFDALDPIAPYGVKVGESTRFEWYAFQLLAEFNKDIAKNMNLKWRYMAYANYETLELKTIDHRLDFGITAKVNNLINVNLGTIVLYDYDQDSGAQISQSLNIGLAYSFQNYEEKK